MQDIYENQTEWINDNKFDFTVKKMSLEDEQKHLILLQPALLTKEEKKFANEFINLDTDGKE